MPLIMTKVYNISGNYTLPEKEILQEMINEFRLKMSDDDPEQNIILEKTNKYTDNKIVQFLKASMGDINSGVPITRYSIFQFVKLESPDLIIHGAMIIALISEGLLQLRNQMDYSDSGLNISLFNKTGLYQGWAGFLLQQYLQDKKEFKSRVLANSPNSGFVGITSEFGYRW